jgi:hypothetical protein
LFSMLPFGSDLTAEEVRLAAALKSLQAHTASAAGKIATTTNAVFSGHAPQHLQPYLQRMQLDQPKTLQEQLWQKLLVNALEETLAKE